MIITSLYYKHNKSSLFYLTVFFLFFPALLNAQTADFIQTLLQTRVVSYGQAASFVLEAADVKGSYNKADEQDALRFASEKKWLPVKAGAQEPIPLDRLSHLIMKAFDLKGGLMYSLFNFAHYSYREMVYKDIIQGQSDPQMKVTGGKMLFIVSRLLYLIDKNPWAMKQQTQIIEEAKIEEEKVLAREISAQLDAMKITNTNVRITDEGVTISLSNIQFLANSSQLPEREKQTIVEIARILINIPNKKILVTGHTALAGTEQDRLLTSRERAQAVADYLVSLGVRRKDEIEVRGYGSSRPIADNNTPEGMALNRRVEITLLEDIE
jgi:outer membrane protein OmpA-like peptidoglycan-associated protein